MKRILAFIATITMISACGHNVQTTSGKEYLAKYAATAPNTQNSGDANDINKRIHDAAAIEPNLSFPARIGIARIERGGISNIPPEELEIFLKTKEKLGTGFGEFVPVSPLVVESLKQNCKDCVSKVVDDIRVGSARQHLDAVFIYEVYDLTESDNNILAIADLTIIGGFILPSRHVEAKGFANAILIDIMQGYPYGNLQATVTKKELATAWSDNREIKQNAKLAAVEKLSGDTYDMFMKLRAELAEKQAKKK
ncbi:MAG: hypothetical protein WCL30_06040 [Pseudomonadota bacterium]